MGGERLELAVDGVSRRALPAHLRLAVVAVVAAEDEWEWWAGFPLTVADVGRKGSGNWCGELTLRPLPPSEKEGGSG